MRPPLPESGDSGPCLSVDLGGSKLLLGLVQADGSIQAVQRVEPAPEQGEKLLEIISGYVDSLSPDKRDLPKRCGVAVPGLTDSAGGLWRHSSYSGVEDWPIRDELEERLGMPVFIANDVDACAVGERLWGGAAHEPNYLWITLSNGVGGAIVLDGHLYRGPGFAAGEVGHMKAVRDGIPCECGGRGCLEQYASGRAISRHYEKRVGDSLSAAAIAERAREGDQQAKAAFSTAATHLGDVLADAIMLLNIPCVFLGGGVAQAFDLMEKPLQDALERNLYPEANTLPRIQVTRLGYEAALLGAAAVAHPDARESIL
ncbi:MAG: ROK family protein [Puniceicoccaceae bacterium]